jgi:DNA-binding transcriptional ArsR family regulator
LFANGKQEKINQGCRHVTSNDVVCLLAKSLGTHPLNFQTMNELQVFKAEFFRVLAHPIRIRILEILSVGDRTVQELQDALQLDQPLVSQQLAVLRGKNVVVARKLGTTVKYAVRDPLVAELLKTARLIFENHLTDTQTMLRELRKERR